MLEHLQTHMNILAKRVCHSQTHVIYYKRMYPRIPTKKKIIIQKLTFRQQQTVQLQVSKIQRAI